MLKNFSDVHVNKITESIRNEIRKGWKIKVKKIREYKFICCLTIVKLYLKMCYIM